MNENILKKFLPKHPESFCKRSLVLYVFLFLAFRLIIDFDLIIFNAQKKALDRVKPVSYEYLIDFVRGDQPFDKKAFEEYEYYYKKIIQYVPKRPDAYGLLGYCSYYLGKVEKAKSYYRKAIQMNDEFFWFYYNLGLIHYREGEYSEAIKNFEIALKTDAKATLLFIVASETVYLPIATKRSWDYENSVQTQLLDGFRRAFQFLTLSYQKEENYAKVYMVADQALADKLDDDGFFSYYKGYGAFHLGKYVEAVSWYRGSISKNPYNAVVYKDLARGFEKLNQEDFANLALRQAGKFGKMTKKLHTWKISGELEIY